MVATSSINSLAPHSMPNHQSQLLHRTPATCLVCSNLRVVVIKIVLHQVESTFTHNVVGSFFIVPMLAGIWYLLSSTAEVISHISQKI